jgi:8-oxo-dGTP diphosphatase
MSRSTAIIGVDVIARSAATKQSSFLVAAKLDCFAELVIRRRFAPTGWLAMTVEGSMAELKLTLVVACALVDPDKRILLAQRPEGKTLAGLWEFPGGKVEPGERPEATLIRELHEELGIDVSEPCLAPLTFASHAYETFHLLMPLYICRRWEGQVTAREGQNLAWVRANKLRDYPMPPADIPLIPHLIDLLL